MYLDARKIFWQNIGVAQTNLHSCLRSQVVNHQLVVGFIVVMKSWFFLRENKVRFEADHIMEEPSEFVHFAAHNNIWPRVLLKIALMQGNFALKSLTLLCQAFNLIPELQDFKEVFLLCKLLLLLNLDTQVLYKRT